MSSIWLFEIAEDLKVALSTEVFLIETIPDKLDKGISLTPYLGFAIGGDQTVLADEQRVQCFIRALKYYETYELAWQAYQFLVKRMEEGFSYLGYRIIEFLQSPHYLQRDSVGRFEMVFNFILVTIL